MRDLISASIAAISRYSPASSSCSSFITLDVVDVLPGDLGDRDIEDVEVLAADQIEQQVERPLEGLEENLQRVGRNVEVPRQFGDGLALDDGKRHFALGRLAGGGFLRQEGFGRSRCVVDHRERRFPRRLARRSSSIAFHASHPQHEFLDHHEQWSKNLIENSECQQRDDDYKAVGLDGIESSCRGTQEAGRASTRPPSRGGIGRD